VTTSNPKVARKVRIFKRVKIDGVRQSDVFTAITTTASANDRKNFGTTESTNDVETALSDRAFRIIAALIGKSLVTDS